MAVPISSSIPPHEFPSQWQPVRELGRGGMGRVLEVRHHPSGRLAALKIVEQADSPEILERFDLEARIMAGLRHPGLLRVFDVVRVGHRPAIVLEKMAGSLEDRLRREGPIDWRVALGLIVPVAEGLEYAHSRGILHRDIKPANILLDDAGAPRLADFGLARLAADSRSLTETGVVLGTPKTMAPEQIETPRLIDARADIYALGATLYELLGGVPVVRGKTVLEVCRKVLAGDVMPIGRRVEGLPEGVEELVMSCLARDRDARPRSAGELAGACRRLLAGQPLGELSSSSHAAAAIAARTPRTRAATRGSRPTLALTLLVLAVTGGSAAWLTRERDRLQRTILVKDGTITKLEDASRETTRELQNRTAEVQRVARSSADARRLAEQRKRELQSRRVARLEAARRALAAGRTLRARAIAKSCEALSLENNDQTTRRESGKLIRAAELASPLILRVPQRFRSPVTALAFSSSGRYLAAASGQTIAVWQTANGELVLRRRLARSPVIELRVQDDGRSLAIRTPDCAISVGPDGAVQLRSISGSRAASLSLDGRALLWQTAGQSSLRLLQLRPDEGPNALGVASGEDGLEVQTGLEAPPGAVTGAVSGAAIAAIVPVDRGWLVSIPAATTPGLVQVGFDGAIRRPSAPDSPDLLPAPAAGQRLIAATPDLEALMFRDRDGRARLRRGSTETLLPSPLAESDIASASLSRSGTVAYRTQGQPRVHLISREGLVRSLPVLDAKPVKSGPATPPPLLLGPTGDLCAEGDAGGVVRIWGLKGEPPQFRLRFALDGPPEPESEHELHACWVDRDKFVVVDRRGEQWRYSAAGERLSRAPGRSSDDDTLFVRSHAGQVTVVTQRGSIEREGHTPTDSVARDAPIRDLALDTSGRSFVLLNSKGVANRLGQNKGLLGTLTPSNSKGSRAIFLCRRREGIVLGHDDGRITLVDDRGQVRELRAPGSPTGGPAGEPLSYRSSVGGEFIALFSPRTGAVELFSQGVTPFRGVIPGLRDLAVIARSLLLSLDREDRVTLYQLPSFAEISGFHSEFKVRRLEPSPDSRQVLLIGREVALLDVRAGHAIRNIDLGHRLLTFAAFPLTKDRPGWQRVIDAVGPDGVTRLLQKETLTRVTSPQRMRRVSAPSVQGRFATLGPTVNGQARLELFEIGQDQLKLVSRTRLELSAPALEPVRGPRGVFAVAAGHRLHVWIPTEGADTKTTPRVDLATPLTALTADPRSPGGFAFATADGSIHRLTMGAEKPARVATLPGHRITALSLDAAGLVALLGTADGRVRDWGSRSGGLRVPASSGPPIRAICHDNELGYYAYARGDVLEIRGLAEDRVLLRRSLGSRIVRIDNSSSLLWVATERGRLTGFNVRMLGELGRRQRKLAPPLSLQRATR